MSDSDSLPDLVESSDDDNVDTSEQTGKGLVYADTWLKKGIKYLENQEQWIRVFSLGPFLFGVNNIVSAAWNKALYNVKLILNEKKDFETPYLEWQEWECVDLVDHVISEVQRYLRNRTHLSKSLECAGKLDECKDGVVIDVDLAIDVACKTTEISDLWRSVLKHEVSSGREKAAKFAVLYVMRIYREHVMYLCEKSADFIDHTRRQCKITNKSSDSAEKHKRDGNSYFKNSAYQDAVKEYSKAAREDPFNHVYYGNRAQAYLVLKQYRDALADGRRAVTIKPDFPKGHYRYAVAFYSLGQLDSAIRVTSTGLELCLKSSSKDQTTLKELELQGQTYYLERTERNNKNWLTPVPKDLEDKLASFPNVNTDITEKLGCKIPEIRKGKDGVTKGVSSDSESDNVSTDHKKVRRKKKKGKADTSSSKKGKEKSESMVMPLQGQDRHVDKSNAKLEKQQLKEEFMTYLSDGSDSYMKQAYKRAMRSYQKALEMLSLNGNKQLFGMDDSDVLTLKYSFSITAIATNVYKNILDGIERLEEIRDYCETHDDIKFPVLYYGLGKAYVSLNRFPEAQDPLQDGFQVASSVTYSQVTWPGTKQLIKETDPTCLQESLKNLLQMCKFPPTPDAVCRNHVDPTDKRTVIYLKDPDFKGYTKIICQMDCMITFHPFCFKEFRVSLNKTGDKDVLDTVCPTPDCVGYIMKIQVVRSDSLRKEYVSEKYTELKENSKNKKPVAKQKTSNETKIAKKQEKKDKRKQKKKEYTALDLADNTQAIDDDEVITDGASAMAFIADMENEVQTLPDVKDTTVLKKDVIDVQKPGKGRKGKKKSKEKSKQILNVEVNFSDRKEETLLNENSVLSDEEKENKSEPIENPFTVPTQLKSQIHNFEKSYQVAPKPALLSKPDEVTENLFLFFVDILKANGPLAIDDTRIQQELEVFPQEAMDKIKAVGGLGDFLRQSLKFAVIDDVISLMSDAKRAREIALIRRQERQNTGTEPVVQSVWKTVGKGVNNVDSLTESVKTSVTPPSSSFNSGVVSVSSQNDTLSTSSSLSNLNNSSSFVPFSDIPVPSESKPAMHWSEGVSTFDLKNPIKPPAPVPVINTLDSIDDFPFQDSSGQNMKKDLDGIDDLDGISESGSEIRDSQESGNSVKNGLKLDPRMSGLDIARVDSISHSSSKSDISDSYKSDFSSDVLPKPVKSTSSGSAFGSIGQPKGIWDKLESDFDSAWSKVSKEEYSGVDKESVESVTREVQRIGDEFVRKSDETFVAELAESVVAKLFEGKKVSEIERAETLKKVSADIWKDFERSANAVKKGGSSFWANTPAGADYSKNMGKFATDFMKRHYDNSETSSVSPTSDLNTLQQQKNSPLPDNLHKQKNLPLPDSLQTQKNSPLPDSLQTQKNSPLPDSLHKQKNSPLPDSFSSFSDDSRFNSALPWPDQKTGPEMQGQPSVSSSSSGYNLFSGPTWGFNSFNNNAASNAAQVIVPPRKPIAPPPGPFIRPPMPASSYYQNPNMPIHFRQPPPRMPMPPPMGMPFPPQFRCEKRDQDTQIEIDLRTIGTMTDAYEPLMKEYRQMKESRDEAMRVMSESKTLYEKLIVENKAKEQQVLVLEADINNKVGMFDLEKKSWKNEREAFIDQIKKLQEQIRARDSLDKELKEKMIGQERKVNELAILAKDQRDKDLLEIRKYMENVEKYQSLHESQMQRAISAETDILSSRLQAAKGVLERAQKEATFHQQRLFSIVQKHEEENKRLPPLLQQAVDFWSAAVKSSDDNLIKIKSEYEGQIIKVKEGTMLADLEQINIPSPPTVPESIRTMPFMQPGMPGFMMPRMQFPNRPPFSNSGIGKIPSPVSRASPGFGGPGSVQKPSDSGPQVSQTLVQTAAVSGSSQPVVPSMQAPSRPLASLNSGPVRPDAMAPRVPLAVPNRPPLRTLGGMSAQMTSFDKLVVKLKMSFPDKSRAEITQLIHGLRQKRGGSLSGLTIEEIVHQISELIFTLGSVQLEEPTSSQHTPAASKPVGPPPGLSTSWAFKVAGPKELPSRGSGSELFRDEEEDPCVICHEEMDPTVAVTLECGHLFHDECIRKWFQEQSTCPNCRVHTLLCDEYPSLG